MKYMIKWTGWKLGWSLTYRTYDEGGGGWNVVTYSSFRWVLRIRARFHYARYQRQLRYLSVKEIFEL